LLLDEIGELELALQAKLLRVLEEGAFRRVGGLKDIPLDVRVLAASNRDLKTESEAGRFRLDLYYRLSIIQIDIPPLRERGNDVLLLAQHYIETIGARLRLRKKITGLSPEVTDVFLKYNWPGNVRELEQAVKRIILTGHYHGIKRDNRKQDDADRLAQGMKNGQINAERVLSGYCTLLYQRFGTYEEVSRRTQLDRRTVKKYVQMGFGSPSING